jgi:hypothetical protein
VPAQSTFIPPTVNPSPIVLSPATPSVVLEGPRSVQAFGNCQWSPVDPADNPTGPWTAVSAADGVVNLGAGTRRVYAWTGGNHCPLRLG